MRRGLPGLAARPCDVGPETLGDQPEVARCAAKGEYFDGETPKRSRNILEKVLTEL